MEVDTEAPVDPTILNSLITVKVSAATKKLTLELNKLKKELKESRDSAGARKKKRANVAGVKSNDIQSDKNKKQNTSKKKSQKSSHSKPGASAKKSSKSKNQQKRN